MFAERLSGLRKSMKISQYELADRLGMSRGQLANYEQGKRQPDQETLVKLADFFNVSTDYLLGRIDNLSTGTKIDKDEAEFQAFANNPELNVFYKELPESDEEAVRKLRAIWEIIKNEK